MYRILLNISRLTLTCILLIGVSLLLGRAQPLDWRVTTLHLTDCAIPCWIGIEAEQTTQEEAQALFRKAYPEHEPFLIMPNDGGGWVQAQLDIQAFTPAQVVPHIMISGDLDNTGRVVGGNSTFLPRLGDVLLLWGPPTCAFADASALWVLRYQRGLDGSSVVDIKVIGHRLSPHQSVYNFSFYRILPQGSYSCLPHDTPARRRWFGFANLP